MSYDRMIPNVTLSRGASHSRNILVVVSVVATRLSGGPLGANEREGGRGRGEREKQGGREIERLIIVLFIREIYKPFSSVC